MTDARILKYVIKTMSLSSGSAELPGVFSSNPYPAVVNASLWTLKYELLCYFILAVVAALKLWERRKLTLILVGGWLSASIFLTYRFGPNPDWVQHLARFWFSFSFGVGLFLFHRHVP